MPPKRGRQTQSVYTEAQVDDISDKFEKCFEKLKSNKGSIVKKNAAERDFLKCAQQARDLFKIAVGGDKLKLESIFGGSCRRFHRLRNIMKATEFTPASAKDSRWSDLHEEMNIIQQVLEDMGWGIPAGFAHAPL